MGFEDAWPNQTQTGCLYRSADKCFCPERAWLADLELWPTHEWALGHIDSPSAVSDKNIIRYAWHERAECPMESADRQLLCPFAAPAADAARLFGIRPSVQITAPDPFEKVSAADVMLVGKAPPASSVTIGEQAVTVGSDGGFSIEAPLAIGANDLLVEVTDPIGKSLSYTRVVERVETDDEFVASCRDIEYRVLKKDAKRLAGTRIHVVGKVTGIHEEDDGSTWVQLNTIVQGGGFDDVIADFPNEVSFYEEDVVEIWGEVSGFFTGATPLGPKTVPRLSARVACLESVARRSDAAERSTPTAVASAETPTTPAPAHLKLAMTRANDTRSTNMPDSEFWTGCQEVIAEQKAIWGVLDDELYGLCSRHPKRDDTAGVVAKVAIIGRGYATRIDALVPAEDRSGPGSAIREVARILAHNHAMVDGLIASLPDGDDLRVADLETLVAVHGQLTTLIRDSLAKGQTGDAPKSFVSKYLHFHKPVVPIYDSYSEAVLKVFRSKALAAPLFKYDKARAYKSYWEHCLAFASADESARANGLELTVKELDAFLLSK